MNQYRNKEGFEVGTAQIWPQISKKVSIADLNESVC